MGRRAVEGESPVGENRLAVRRILSTAGHEEPGGNTGGPPSKPKYYPVTDSEAVPRGKGEKYPGRGVK